MAVTLQETVTLDDRFNYELVNTTTAVVDGVIRDFEIENLPLNGRNFLELALLIPATRRREFRSTKTNTVVISSAGQLGRGGNVTVDAPTIMRRGGGQVQNIRRKQCRSFRCNQPLLGSVRPIWFSVINIVTKSDQTNITVPLVLLSRQGAAGSSATFDGPGSDAAIRPEQYAFSLGGPISKDRAWFLAPLSTATRMAPPWWLKRSGDSAISDLCRSAA